MAMPALRCGLLIGPSVNPPISTGVTEIGSLGISVTRHPPQKFLKTPEIQANDGHKLQYLGLCQVFNVLQINFKCGK
jgi:hypothetical protein